VSDATELDLRALTIAGVAASAPREQAPPPAAEPDPAVVIKKGTRFYSRGLRSYCVVTDVEFDLVHFKATSGDFATDIPLDLAVAHIRAGRWDVTS
jgi:hypothetical protein